MNPDGQRPSSKKKWLKESNIMELKVNSYNDRKRCGNISKHVDVLICLERDELQYSLS